MLCVVDSSFTATLFLPDETNDESAALAGRIGRDGATAPALWQLEMANLLLVAERRKRITPAMHKQITEALDVLPITVQSPLTRGQRSDVIHLARRYALTAYDAAYLELSVRLNLPLATFDEALRKASKAEGVAILP
jgi:predicted nucleic acid-binding protein